MASDSKFRISALQGVQMCLFLIQVFTYKKTKNLSPYRPTETGIRNNSKLYSGQWSTGTLKSCYEHIDQFPPGFAALPGSNAPAHCFMCCHSASGMTFLSLHPSWPHFKRVLENMSSSLIYLGS